MFLFPRPSPPAGAPGRGARRGSLLLEALLAVAVFSLFVGAIGLSMILGERSTVAGGDRARAAFLAEQSIEAVRFLRDARFDLLDPGTYHPVISSENGSWSLEPGAGTTEDGYVVDVEIVAHGENWIEAIAGVSWNFGGTRTGDMSVNTFLTNWRKPLVIGDWSSAHLAVTTPSGDQPDFRGIALSGTAAFLVGMSSLSGAGLYMYDIADVAAPLRIAPSFSLGAGGTAVAVDGADIFVGTDDTSGEVRHYIADDPALLDASSLVGTYDLPDGVTPLSLAFFNGTLFVGTDDNASGEEFLALGVDEETGEFTLLDSLETDGGVTDIRLHDGYAYLSSTYDGGELQVIDVFDPAELVFDPGRGMDLPDTFDGLTIAAFGTSAVLGRASGTSIDEMILYSIADSPLPSPPPGPWTTEAGGAIISLDTEPGGHYLFAGGDTSGGQFRVLDVTAFSQGDSPLLDAVSAGTTIFALLYDWRSDRVFAVSSDDLLIFAPGP